MARAVTSKDLLSLAFVSDPQLAPNGERAAVVLTRIEREDDGGAGSKEGSEAKAPRYTSQIELYDLTSKARTEPLMLTRGRYSDTSPRFSPSGDELAFLSVRDEKGRPQIYLIGLAGGEARPLTHHAAGVTEFAWHPDGKRIAYVSRGDWKEQPAPVRKITKRRWRFDGAGILPTEPAQVYLLDVTSGKSRQLTDLPESAAGLVFSPDGRTLYLTSQGPEKDQAQFRSDALTVQLESGEASVLLRGVLGLNNLAPSPDGRSLAYGAAADQSDMASAAGLWLLDLEEGGQPRLLSDQLETQHSAGGDSRFGAYPGGPSWLLDGSLLVLANREGATNLVRIDQDGQVTDVQSLEQRVVTAFSALTQAQADQPTAVFLAETTTQPGELWFLAAGRERRVSHVNDAWRRRLELVAAQGPFQAGQAGAAYWTMEPLQPRADRAAVLQVHGGPHTNYGYGFNLEFQLLAAHGYAVIFGNPRGSSSYGYTFATAMLGAYGSVDADDIMAFATEGAKRLGRAKAPLHLTGGSYGGFMTNWLVGQTDRFASAVTQRSICNWTSMYGTSDIGPAFVERQLGGVPWGDAEALWRQSPLRNADKITTPLLIIHSEEDHRCPIEQAEQLFAVLKRVGKAETEFLRVPGEGHELSRSGRPDRRVARLDAIVDWFERHP